MRVRIFSHVAPASIRHYTNGYPIETSRLGSRWLGGPMPLDAARLIPHKTRKWQRVSMPKAQRRPSLSNRQEPRIRNRVLIRLANHLLSASDNGQLVHHSTRARMRDKRAEMCKT